MPTNKISVLISGNGSNLQALIDACTSSKIPETEIIQVIHNYKDAFGGQRAKNAGIPTCYHNLLPYKRKYPKDQELQAREEYDSDLAVRVLSEKPDLVICAGWTHILAPSFLIPLSNAGVPVINLHPALPGQFNGANAIERAYEAFQEGAITKTGVMIHYVISEVDMGEPILVREIDFQPGESLDELKQRIHMVEWVTIVEGANMALSRLRKIASPKN